MSSSSTAIRVDGLSKCYALYDSPRDRLKQFILPRASRALGLQPKAYHREFWALRNISFEIARGETCAIIGKNGSGKSTLLQIICGTLAPTTGVVDVQGRVAALLELGAGFNPEFSGRENVYMNGRVLGLSTTQIDERFDRIAAFADIGEFIERPVKTYSSGMFVRLAFAVSVHVDADVLIVDEALSVGDLAFQMKCARRIRQFLETGGTLLFVSHDLGLARSLCQTGIYLQKGQLRRAGAAEQVCGEFLADMNEESGLAARTVAVRGDAEPDSSAAAGPQPADEGAAPVTAANGILLETEAAFRAKVEPFRRHRSEDCEVIGVTVEDGQGRPATLVGFGDEVVVRVRLRALRQVAELVVAMYVRDRTENDLLGTNTAYEDVPLENLQAGQELEVRFSFPNYLRAGEYGVCVIAADRPIVTGQYYDWIDFAASLKTVDRFGKSAWAQFNPAMKVSTAAIDADGPSEPM